jgi:hypothetical protein
VPVEGLLNSGCPGKRPFSLVQGKGHNPSNLDLGSSQDQDLEPLKPGAPIFKLFNGEDVLYEGDSTVFPLFINEAAYYEKHLAFMKSEKITISVPALSALTSASTLAL